MKNIQAQYKDLLEGKMSSANFMVSVRRDFPQWVSSTNSFKDAVSILKSKRIINEDIGTAQADFDASQQGLEEAVDITPDMIEKALKDMWEDGLIDDMTWKTASKGLPNFDIKGNMRMVGPTTAEDLARELILVATGEHVEDVEDSEDDDDMYNDMRADDDRINRLHEAAIKNPNAEAPTEIGYDHVNYHQLMKGMEFELAKAKDITDEALVKAKQTALKNIKKDPNAYRDLIIANVKDVLKKDATLKMQPVKKDNMVDKANGMKVVKKDEKGNVQTTLGKKEKASKGNKGVKEMTQSPKKVKGVQAFETPGKEKVLALKEHLMNEFGHMQQEVTPEFRVGSRVETKDGRFTGVVTAFDGHIATVKIDSDGSERDLQPNILKHSSTAPKPQVPQVPADHLKNMPGLGSVKEVSKEDKLKAIKEKLMKFVKKEMEEGAVAQTVSGVTVASGMNTGDVTKKAADLKKQTGDPFTVLDTKSGVKRKI